MSVFNKIETETGIHIVIALDRCTEDKDRIGDKRITITASVCCKCSQSSAGLHYIHSMNEVDDVRLP